MSALSVSHSPSRWIPDSPRRKPQATTTTVMAAPARPPLATNHPSAALTSSKPAITNFDDDAGHVHGAPDGEDGVRKANLCGSRISFAPDTAFHDRTRLKSRGASKRVTATFNFRSLTPGEKPQAPKLRFQLPKATLPSLHYLSVSQEDFLDPRYAQDIVKTYGIPRYFFRSKSTLLTSSVNKPQLRTAADTDGTVVQTGVGIPSENDKQKQSTTIGKEAEGARPKTSGETSTGPGFPHRFPVAPVASGSAAPRSTLLHDKGLGGGDEGSKTQAPAVAPVYKPLIGEKYTDARFFPTMNPHRSLQLESEVTKYVEHKKRVGLGRYVQFEAGSVPSSGLVREASMYDLNHEGPAQRPLEQYPDRKPFIRQRPRDPKHDFLRSADDRDLVIMPRERTASQMSNAAQKDVSRSRQASLVRGASPTSLRSSSGTSSLDPAANRKFRSWAGCQGRDVSIQDKTTASGWYEKRLM